MINEFRRYRFIEIFGIVSETGNTESYMCSVNEKMKLSGIAYTDIMPDDLIEISACGLSTRSKTECIFAESYGNNGRGTQRN